MRSSAGYRYPDPGDHVTSAFVREHEPYPGYWEISEQRGLDRLGEQLAALLPARDHVRALDAGTGEGRLLPMLSRFAADIVAMDPDADRLAAARHAELPGTRVDFVNREITDYDGGPFDLILCSHVMQHVPTTRVEPILRALHACARPGAVLVLSCSRSAAGRGRFSLDRVDQTGALSEDVDQARFDQRWPRVSLVRCRCATSIRSG